MGYSDKPQGMDPRGKAQHPLSLPEARWNANGPYPR